MSAAACLSVNTVDVYNSELIAGNNTTLVQTEAILLLSITFVHESFSNIDGFVDQTICLIFDSKLFFFGKTLVVGNIQVSLVKTFNS